MPKRSSSGRRPSASRARTASKCPAAKPSASKRPAANRFSASLSAHDGQAHDRDALNRELITKRRGELAELAFTLKAASLGFAVSKPYGDSERYDFILDSRNASSIMCHSERRRSFAPRMIVAVEEPAKKTCHSESGAKPGEEPVFPRPLLHRVQVKCSTQLIDGLYRVNGHRRLNGGTVPYLPSEIDFLAACIIPEDTWYIIPIHAIRSASLLFRRRGDPKPGLYDPYREAWHLLRNHY